VPEARRLLLAMTEADARRRVRLGWSRWRRAHQAMAARCRAARRALGRDRPATGDAAVALAPGGAGLTEAEWVRVRPLLPPQRPPTGRPRHDHRTALSGILAVVRSDCSWREMPTQFGKWEAAYSRYRLWRKQGLWRRILGALENEPREGSL
jgi:hypothetical protein